MQYELYRFCTVYLEFDPTIGAMMGLGVFKVLTGALVVQRIVLLAPVFVVPNIFHRQTRERLVEMQGLASVLLAKPYNGPYA